MIKTFKRWRRRREIIRRLVAYAKTKDGRKFIEEMNQGNLIMADLDAAELGAENPYIGRPWRIRLPKDHFVHIGSGWMDK